MFFLLSGKTHTIKDGRELKNIWFLTPILRLRLNSNWYERQLDSLSIVSKNTYARTCHLCSYLNNWKFVLFIDAFPSESISSVRECDEKLRACSAEKFKNFSGIFQSLTCFDGLVFQLATMCIELFFGSHCQFVGHD